MQNSKPIVLIDIDDTMFNTALFKESNFSQNKAYDDVIRALENLNTLAILGIFSKGEIQFQKAKLEKTDLFKFFNENNVHIFDDKNVNLRQVVAKYSNSKIFLIDDRLEVLCSAKKNVNDIFTIWMKRGRYVNQEKITGFAPDSQVENLMEVVKIVRSNLN